jgi:hypothetical protein
MRNKPTIISFKTPSLEHCEAAMALLPSDGSQSPEGAAEEGRSPAVTKLGPQSDDIGLEAVSARPPLTSMIYPVGKPLEVSITFCVHSLYSAHNTVLHEVWMV